MKHPTAAVFFAVLSIAVIPAAVKAQSASPKTDLKDSVKDNDKKDLAQLIDFLLKNGNDITIGPNLAPVIGLPGAMPAKSKPVRNKIKGTERDALNCALIYEESTDASVLDGKRPTSIYLMRMQESGHDTVSQYFRINLDGQLERVITNHGKKDADGQRIAGSGVAVDDDKDSPAVRRTYAAEMRELKSWLKKQQKLLVKADATRAKSDKEEAVKASASAESKVLDKEAAAAPPAAQ